MNNNYIKMCKAATEIQELKFYNESSGIKLYKLDRGDYFERYDSVFKIDTMQLYQREFINSKDMPITWLPDFGQLLNIYQEKNDIPHESWALLWLANFIEDEVKKDHSFCVIKYKTKEEVAILWIMETCFNKIWDGNKWIKL